MESYKWLAVLRLVLPNASFGISLHSQHQHLYAIYRGNKLIWVGNATKEKKIRPKFKQIKYLKIVVFYKEA